MSKVYSDAEMLLATQVAYMNINVAEGQTVGEYVDMILNADGAKDAKGELGKQYEVVQTMVELAEKNGIDDWKSWKVVDACDKQKGSGMYVCLIDTGKGDAIVGFRGSESFDAEQKVKDWVVADVGLLNSCLTQQQKDAEDYTRYIWERYGEKYDSFSFTGHSLGGNLAVHATIAAPEEMRGKIDHTIGFDSPGFSNEYLKMHEKGIDNSSDVISHYQWSWVGALLTQPKGVEDRVIKAHDDPNAGGSILGIVKSKLWRHDTRNVELENGSVQDGEKTELADPFGTFSRVLDNDLTILLLPVISPILSTIDLAHRVSSFFRAYQEELKAYITDAVNAWKDFIDNTYKKIFAAQVSGNYSVNIDSVASLSGSMKSVMGKIERCNAEISSIQKSLRYDSIAGCYYKSKIWVLCNSLSGDAKKASKFSVVAEDAGRLYSTADNTVAELYA